MSFSMMLKATHVINELFSNKRISASEFRILMMMDEEGAQLTESLRTNGKISWREHRVLRDAIEKEQEVQRKLRVKDRLREVDRNLNGRGSPVVQGGLPSLGKRRP